ncbi:SNF2 family N-terminal domain-domain-containing protein [Absidia repens]|uniref:SNF2 family N-terminal domain-domain-containing protein n=1 Tax=Absidia repens TaxID=90262 RepID=A0A1X2IWU7_9FUNG|nr:SNF2 family N-terminal domain-domain-containing protein [Absidia repens]
MDRKPSSQGPSSSALGLSVIEAEEQLRQLLETIADEEPPPPESRTGTPDGLRINLMEHQKIGFQWMCKQEVSTNKGGLLSDDMGLGKTIQTLSVIVARQCTDAAPIPDMMTMVVQQKLKARIKPFKVKCTLVVCPVSLMEQWAQEIKSKAENVSVYIHHGTSTLQDPYQIAGFDVVIISYHKARHEFPEDSTRATGVLTPMIFHRVVLDEAHTIKNKATGVAKACYRIEATYRWCLTATPIQNKIEELYSLINFLRIQPYCDWTNFRDEIVTPLKSVYKRQAVMKKVQVIMKAIALRRSKKAEIDGRPILNLPERNIHFTHVDFPSDERQFYNFVDNKVQTDFNEYVDAGTVMQNYSSVLVLLLRLRQACLHPTLTTIDKPVLKNNEERQLENAKSLDQSVVDRLVNMKDELSGVECPICMDAADEPRIISGCGHILCRECLSSYVNTSSDYGGSKSCPQCRGELRLESTVPVAIFFKIHIPELAAVEEKEDPEMAEKVNEIRYESSKKIDTMLEILAKTREDSNGRDKTIVFSQFTQMLDLMEKPLKENGIKFGRYDGSMAVKTRTAMIETYRNDPSMEVLLVSTRCGSLGLNLTMANRVILMDVWWNPALENQAIDRVHRIGQTKDVEVHRLFINNTVEDRILELQKRKQLIADSALGEGGAEKLGRLGLQDMLYLFRGGPPPPMPSRGGPSSAQ